MTPKPLSQSVRSVQCRVQGQPPLSWKQGFFFSNKSGLQFGLVQNQGGPCGVLAAVQAHILAALWEEVNLDLAVSPVVDEALEYPLKPLRDIISLHIIFLKCTSSPY